MAGEKGGASLGRGGGPDPGGWLHWDGLPGRTGPGGKAQSLYGVRVMWTSPCAHAGTGSALGRAKAVRSPRPCRGCAGTPRSHSGPADPPPEYGIMCMYITNASGWAALETSPSASSSPTAPAARRPGSRRVPPSPPTLLPTRSSSRRSGPDPSPAGGRAAPHTLAAPRGRASSVPLPPQANESHPISVLSCKAFFFPPPGAEPSLEGLRAAGTAQTSRAMLGLRSWDRAHVASFLLPFQFSTSPVPSLGPFGGYVHRDVYLHVL